MKKTIINIYIPVAIATAGIFQPLFSSALVTARGTKTVAANPEFNKASAVKRIMLGKHYRKEWATPVEFPIIDLEKTAGGLTAMKMGGGMQTKSLRMQGADGREYVLRSVKKDPSKAIVAELRETFAEDVVQDQISSSNPYAPMVVASLLQSAGILHSTPQLVYVPASPRLGEYASTFAETLCLFEERPAGNEEPNENFDHSKKIVNSDKLFEKVFSNSNHQVDEKAYLKARLFDMLIGDWDRHEDQWVWASFEENEKTFYRPIPRDRDQAFSSMDGVIPGMASQKWVLRKTQNFDYSIRDINGLNMSANHMDRNFTTRLALKDWLAVADDLQKSLTNRAIDDAFDLMPASIYRISGAKTKNKLKSRRNDLQKYALKYYAFLTEQVAITGTNGKESFEVTRLNDGSTTVTVYDAGKKSRNSNAVYQRNFSHAETKEILLYGLDGNDTFTINGNAEKGTLVRIIGGNGKDIIVDQSTVKGEGHHTKVYDNADNTFNTSSETKTLISEDSLKNVYHRKGFRYNWFAPVQRPGYNPDDGLYVGGGIIFKKQQFGKAPYGYMISVGGNYAFQTSAYNFWYNGTFKEFMGKWDLHTSAAINAPNYSRNYFGLGNETERRKDREKNYYRIRFNQIITEASLRRTYDSKHAVHAGIGFQSVKLENTDNRFVSSEQSTLDSSDFGRKHYGSVKAGYEFSTVNNILFPTKGIKISSGSEFIQSLRETDKRYMRLYTEVAVYNSFGPVTIASRTGVSSNVGNDYEFFQANTIGNFTTLRGYRKDRFAGRTSVYQNTEVRWAVGQANLYVAKGAWGVLGFMDQGRVWMPDESSSKWHRGFGGGVWFLPFSKMVFTATYGASEEDKVISIGTGFLF